MDTRVWGDMCKQSKRRSPKKAQYNLVNGRTPKRSSRNTNMKTKETKPFVE